MAAATIEELENLFNDHPSLDASLQDFEHGSVEMNPSPRFGYPSHHSGFRSETESDIAPSDSGGRYSPPAWRREGNGHRSSGFWNNQRHILEERGRGSRESSPDYESADEGPDATLEAARMTRLPTGSISPEKRRSPSPDRFPSRGRGEFGNEFSNEFGEVAAKDEQGVIIPSAENANNCMFNTLLLLNMD